MSTSALKIFGLIVATALLVMLDSAVSASLAQEQFQLPRKQTPAPTVRNRLLPLHEPPAFVTGVRLPAGTQGTRYAVGLKVTGGKAPLHFDVRGGALPPGLELRDGVLRGVPRSSGDFAFVVGVTDADGISATRKFVLRIEMQPAVIRPRDLIISTPSPLPKGKVGLPYAQQIAVSGGQRPYKLHLQKGRLPPGLSLAGSSLAGKPLRAGNFTFILAASDRNGLEVTKSFDIAIITPAKPLSLSAAGTFKNGTVGVPLEQKIAAAGGTPPYKFAFAGGTPPPGLELVGDRLTGTPTMAGDWHFGIKVTDSAEGEAKRDFSLAISAPLAFTSDAQLASGDVAFPYSQKIEVTGGKPPYVLSAVGALPPGLSLTKGELAGVPTKSGNWSFDVTAWDADGRSRTKTFYAMIYPALSIASNSTLRDGTVGATYGGQALAASGGQGPYEFNHAGGQFPPGLELKNGMITGTPAEAGTWAFVLRVSDGNGAVSDGSFSMTIHPPVENTTSTTLKQATVAWAYSQPLTASGGKQPYEFAVSGALPPGLKLMPGALSGFPSASGQWSFDVIVTDANQASASKSVSLTVLPKLEVTTASILPAGSAGAAFDQPVEAAGGEAPYAFKLAGGAGGGVIPPGLSILNGSIHGTPAEPGTYAFDLIVTDTNNVLGKKQLSLTIHPQLRFKTAEYLPLAYPGVAYQMPLAVAGGVPPYSFALDAGELQAGLSLSNESGMISGTPQSIGTTLFNVRVSDAQGHTVKQSFTLTAVADTSLIPEIITASPLKIVGSYVVIQMGEGSEPLPQTVATPPLKLMGTGQTLAGEAPASTAELPGEVATEPLKIIGTHD